MSLTPRERCNQPRRSADRAADDLQSAFRTCLECIADGVLLLDSETRVLHATPQAEQLLKRQDAPFAITPKFTLRHPKPAARLAAFVNGSNEETGPLSLLLAGENGRSLLLNCFKLPKPAEPDLHAARYLFALRDPDSHSIQQWLVFTEQFNLTQAETRLCRALADGVTLNDYCEHWKLTIGTARSQLHSVFEKTCTRRQSDLMRLIFLLTRTWYSVIFVLPSNVFSPLQDLRGF